jgi:hypothetical protein
VSDSDDLWIEMAQFDTSLADGLWEGSPLPGDAPVWYGRVSALIHAASAPAESSELAGEATIVARMQAVVVETATDPGAIDLRDAVGGGHAVDSPRHLAAGHSAVQRRHQGHGARLVGRIVAVKAAALTTAVVLGVTAAAATTGIVATVVVPALQDRDEPTDEELPATVVDQGGGSSGGSDSPGGSDGSSPLDCVLRPETCERDGLVGAGGSTGANGDDPAGAATEPGATASDATTSEAVGDATEATDGGTGTETTVAPPDETPTEATTTTTEPPPTTTTTEPPPTTTTTEPPAPLVDESAASTTVQA